MKIFFLMTLFYPAVVFSGHERGNGGDGVIKKNHKNQQTIFYDLYERSTPLDLLQKKISEVPVNVIIRNHFRKFAKLLDFNSRPGVQYAGTIDTLSKILGLLADKNPVFATKIIEELNKITWVQAPTRLNPNPDTGPFINLSKVHYFGCGRNIANTVLFSPECAENNMDDINKAAFIIHEAIYNLLQKEKNQIESSFTVRSLTVQVMELALFPYKDLRSILSESGLASIVKLEDQYYQMVWNTFKKSHVLYCGQYKIELNFKSALNFTGNITYNEKNIAFIGLFEAHTTPRWYAIPAVPNFNAKKKMTAIDLAQVTELDDSTQKIFIKTYSLNISQDHTSLLLNNHEEITCQ
jgi:hypothetical protein